MATAQSFQTAHGEEEARRVVGNVQDAHGLLSNVGRAKENHMAKSTHARAHAKSLRSLMNVGVAVEGYLNDLGIRSIEQLASQDADELFRCLRARIGRACDPCLHDTFSAIIHE